MLRWGEDGDVPVPRRLLRRGAAVVWSSLRSRCIPARRRFRAALSLPFLRWLGSRSYGLYLWHWPVFMVTRQQDYPWMNERTRFWLSFAVTFALTELSFRLVERPVRDGSAMRWFRGWRADQDRRARGRGWVTVGAVAGLLSVGVVGTRVATADPVDLTTGGAEQEFVAPAVAAGGGTGGRG